MFLFIYLFIHLQGKDVQDTEIKFELQLLGTSLACIDNLRNSRETGEGKEWSRAMASSQRN